MKKYIIVFVAAFCLGGFCHFCLKSGPKISVVMSTYNRASSVSKAIESILNQSYDNFEFIIINDGSSDNTAEVLAQYAQKDSRIKVLTNDKNRGLIYSLNRGLDEATGKYIARMDDDDFSLPERFAKQLAFMESHPEFAATGSKPSETDETGAFRMHQTPAQCAVLSYFQVPLFHPSAMLRVSFLKKHHIRYSYKYPSAEDTELWRQIVEKGGLIFQAKPVLVRQGQSQKKKNYYYEQIVSYTHYINERVRQLGGTKKIPYGWLTHNDTCYILNLLENNIPADAIFSKDDIQAVKKDYKCRANAKQQ